MHEAPRVFIDFQTSELPPKSSCTNADKNISRVLRDGPEAREKSNPPSVVAAAASSPSIFNPLPLEALPPVPGGREGRRVEEGMGGVIMRADRCC